MLDVLPTALSAAAAEVRACAGNVAVVRPVPVGAVELDAALQRFVARWAPHDLREDLRSAADRLADAAQEYADVEALLVPRALR